MLVNLLWHARWEPPKGPLTALFVRGAQYRSLPKHEQMQDLTRAPYDLDAF